MLILSLLVAALFLLKTTFGSAQQARTHRRLAASNLLPEWKLQDEERIMEARATEAFPRLQGTKLVTSSIDELVLPSQLAATSEERDAPKGESSFPRSDKEENASHGDAEAAAGSSLLLKPWLLPRISNWDEQRQIWREKHPCEGNCNNYKSSILLVSSSRPSPCDNSHGDHIMLKFMKNKMDYGRLHGIKVFYNMAHLEIDMVDYWSKLPLLRTLMISHPEVEWLWWMDSDAIFTDMTFEVPIAKYSDYNLVLHGWEQLVYEKKSWIGINTGIFLLRNCQWSLDLLESWSVMGASKEAREEGGRLVARALSDRPLFDVDDQSALVYKLVTNGEPWKSKIYMEGSYCLHGYWDSIVDKYEEMMQNSRPGYGDERWPFVTHFVGCKPCAKQGHYNETRCIQQMNRAFNFADNQVLQQYGYKHLELGSVMLEKTNR
ncbi:hypothetical protein KP509_03G043200 [Ceratopteris richardii]|nr:hypothetical protein KP509_03G043200 [Ceratopteris richardii]